MSKVGTKLSWVFAGLSAVFLTSTMIMISGPAWIFGTNSDQIAPSFHQILMMILPYFLSLNIAALVILLIAPPAITKTLAALLASLGVAIWIEGTYFLYDFGQMDGQSWAIEYQVWQVALELAVLGIVAVVVWRFSLKKPVLVAGAMSAAALVAFVEPVLRAPVKPDLEVRPVEPLVRFSTDRNLLLVLLDGMQSELFEEVLNEIPGIKETLSGFTYYPDTAGVAYSTVLTLPAVHGGSVYEAGTPVKDHFQQIKTSSFLNEMPSYQSTLVNPVYGICPTAVHLCLRVQQAMASTADAIQVEVNKLLSMSLFRATPLPLKSMVYNEGKWLTLLAGQRPEFAHHTVEGNAFLRWFGQSSIALEDKSTAKFLHLFNTHLPVAVDDDCEYDGSIEPTREGFRTQARCAIEAFVDMLQDLKDKNIYDSTDIVLFSDHGSGGWDSPRGTATELVRSNLTAVANPTLAVKKRGASGPFRTNAQPLSLADIPAIVCELTDDCSIAMDVSSKPRVYQHYKWDGSAWRTNSPVEVTSYEIDGPVFDGRNWSLAVE